MEDHKLQSLFQQNPPSPARETVNSFETTDLTPIISNRSTLPRVARQTLAKTDSVAPPAANLEKIQISVGSSPQHSDPSFTKETRKGIPPWVISFFLHASLITSMALVSVAGNGRKIVDLIASNEDSISLTNPNEVEFKIETPEVSNETMEIDIEQEALSESQDLTSILDDSAIAAALESNSQQQLYESIASAGVSEDVLPRRAADGTGANFFGVDSNGTEFIFIVDCSGSMDDFGRWTHAKRELRRSINGLTTDQRFLIMLYNNGYIAMNNSLELVPSTSQERRKAIRWLNRNHPDSWTFCSEALRQALSLRPDAVFLLSDGKFNDLDDVFIVLDEMNDDFRLRRLNRRQIPIHTVALGNHEGSFTMKQIADENNGVFKLVE